MFKEFIHHVGVHIAQHPKESAAAALAAGEAVLPVAVAAAPYLLAGAVAFGIGYLINEITDK